MSYMEGGGMEGDVTPQALPQHPFGGRNRPVFIAAGPGVIRVGMGDQSASDRSGWIDPGIRSSAVETAVGVFEKRH